MSRHVEDVAGYGKDKLRRCEAASFDPLHPVVLHEPWHGPRYVQQGSQRAPLGTVKLSPWWVTDLFALAAPIHAACTRMGVRREVTDYRHYWGLLGGASYKVVLGVDARLYAGRGILNTADASVRLVEGGDHVAALIGLLESVDAQIEARRKAERDVFEAAVAAVRGGAA